MKSHNFKISLLIWIVSIIVLIISTLVNYYFYDKWWFVALMTVFAATIIFNIFQGKLWKRLEIMLLHCSFVVILLGGLLTFTTSQKGEIHVTKDEPSNSFVNQHDENQRLPFNVNLRKFEIVYYPGTMSCADYIADVFISDDNGTVLEENSISMNNILKYNGFRFYQNEFDDDLNGCTFMVAYDPWGILVTYIGYAMLFLAILVVFFKKIKHEVKR